MLAIFFGRGKHIFNTIALSALIILFLYPHSIFMPSFQLTFMSVIFIVIFTEKFYPLIKTKHKAIGWFFSSILMTISATLGTLPIVLYHFYGFNPFTVLHNLVAVPLMCVIAMPVSLVGMVIPFGELLLRFSGEVLAITIRILTLFDIGYIYPIIRPVLFEILLYFGLVLSLLYFNRRLVAAALFFLIIPLSVVDIFVNYRQRFNNDLCVNVIDVGLGEAMFIEAPEGIRILVDGGGFYKGDFDTGKSVLTPILLSKKILTLDYVINTHPHGDHIGGIPYIIRNFRVRNFASGAYFVREGKFLELIQLVKEKKISFLIWKKGNSCLLKDTAYLVVLNPEADMSVDNLNNASLVIKLVYKETSFLFNGDIDKDIEERLILSGAPLRSNVLKVPHHGSKNASSLPFIFAVKPDIAILSVGKGIRGLPSEEAIQRYRALSIPLLRTDKNGFIRVCSDGKNITYRKYQ